MRMRRLSHADCGEATRRELNATEETVAVVNQANRVQVGEHECEVAGDEGEQAGA